MRKYIYSIMCDGRKGFIAGIVKIPLSVISGFYFLLVLLHRFFYKYGILKTYKADCKVISIGNITLGGTGKTPFTLALVRLLKENGRKAVVLTRGYGEDEWRMLKNMLEDAPLLVGRDRVESARVAQRNYSPDAIVLDDGFQHRRIFKDTNILLIDATNPFGNMKLFPRGILREPIERLRESDLVMLSKTDKGRANVKDIYKVVKAFKSEEDILESFHKPAYLVDLNQNERINLSLIKGKNIAIVSGIADPTYFRYTVESTGANIASEFTFMDHYGYKEKDIADIVNKCGEQKIEYIITTEKDVPKLTRYLRLIPYRLLALHVEFEITKGKGLLLERCL